MGRGFVGRVAPTVQCSQPQRLLRAPRREAVAIGAALSFQLSRVICAARTPLIVEVDGAIHARRPGPDARRDLKLRRAGFRIVRVSAELVLRDLPAAIALIRAAL